MRAITNSQHALLLVLYNYKCKHVIDLCKRLNYIEYDSKVRVVPVGGNRRRGRPKKTKGAFEFRPSDEHQCIFSHSESESEECSSKKPKERKKSSTSKIHQKSTTKPVASAPTSSAAADAATSTPPIVNSFPMCPTCNVQMKKIGLLSK